MTTKGDSFSAKFGMKISEVLWLLAFFTQFGIGIIALALFSDISSTDPDGLHFIAGCIIGTAVLATTLVVAALVMGRAENKPV